MSLAKKSLATTRAAALKAGSRSTLAGKVHRDAVPASAKSRGREGNRPASTLPADVELVLVGALDPLVAAVRRHVTLAPAAALELRADLAHTLEDLFRRKQGSVVPEGDQVLSTQEAADWVGVSRPYMAARIDAGDVPLFQQVGNQRRVLASSVRAWHEESQKARRKAMADLVNSDRDEYSKAD